MPFLLLALIPVSAALGVLGQSSVAVSRGGRMHRTVARLADTGRRPPGAFFAWGVRESVEQSADFGEGIANRHRSELPRRAVTTARRAR